MRNIKLSIIIPVYNTGKYLSQCLDSVLKQSLEDIEVICIDDGSTDLSPQILKKYQQTDTRIQIITKTNDGLGAARNTGLEAASGEFIGFIDSDDFIDQDWFAALYKKAKDTQADIVIGNVKLYFQDTLETRPYRNISFYKELSEKGAFQAADIPRIIESIGVWDRIYRHDFIKQNCLRNPEHVIYEDALFSIQASVLAQRIAVVNSVYYYYRKNTGNAITDREIRNDSYKLAFLKNNFQIKEFLSKQCNYNMFRPHYLKYFLANALWHQSNIHNREIFNYFYQQSLKILSTNDLFDALIIKSLSWKEKLYAILLILHCPFICYSIFFYKRI